VGKQKGREKKGQFLLLTLSLFSLFSLRLFRLSFPPTPYFDEPLRFQAVQELSLGLFPQDFHAHPPLAHLLMALPFWFFSSPSLSPLPRPLPFAPKDVIALPDRLLLLSPNSLSLYQLPFSPPSLRLFCSLPERGEKLFFPSRGGLFAFFSSSKRLFLMEGDKPIASFPLPEIPKGVSLLPSREGQVLICLFDRSLKAFSLGGKEVWEKRLKGTVTAFFSDGEREVFAVALDPPPSLLLLSPQGQETFSLPLPQRVIALSLLYQPSLVAPTEGWGRYILEVLFADGKRARFAPKMGWRFFEVFPESLRGLSSSPESPTIFSFGSHSLYLFNASTGLLEGIVPLPFSPRGVFPDFEGKRAFLWGEGGEMFLFSRPLPLFLCRLAPAFFGGLLLPLLTFLFSLRLTHSFSLSLLSLWLVGLDPLLFWLSRTLMLDIFVTTFSLSSFLLAHLSLSLQGRSRLFALSFLGLSLGLSFASKLNGLFCLPLLFFLLSPLSLPLRLFFLLFVPFLTYLSLWEGVRQLGGYSWGQIFHAHMVMVAFQSQMREVHPTAAPFWAFVLGKGSVLLFHRHLGEGLGVWIFLPLPFWLWLLGLLGALREIRGMGGRVLRDFAQVGFWGLWLFWAFSPRPVHSYYFAPSIPFLSLIAARSFQGKGRFVLFSLWLLSFLWLSPTLFGFPLPLPEGHKISHPLMGWLPFFLHLLKQG